jgi:hypothetical protein
MAKSKNTSSPKPKKISEGRTVPKPGIKTGSKGKK